MNINDEVRRMSDTLINEVLKAVGLPQTTGWRRVLGLLIRRATDRLAGIGLTFDRLIEEHGLPRAAEWSLTHWCKDIFARGREHIPPEGPLLVISNHPGAYDILVILKQFLPQVPLKVPPEVPVLAAAPSAALPARQDVRIIASDLPFIRHLKNTSQRIFFIPMNIKDTYHRMAGMLSAVRYLKDGGAVVLMGSGTIDPDPAVYPGAAANLQRWTEAANVVLRFVPQTRVLLTTVSHILHPKWAHHPLTWLQRGEMQKRRIAEFGQVVQQLLSPGSLYLSPRVSFAEPVTIEELGDSPREALIEMETALLNDHMAWASSLTKG